MEYSAGCQICIELGPDIQALCTSPLKRALAFPPRRHRKWRSRSKRMNSLKDILVKSLFFADTQINRHNSGTVNYSIIWAPAMSSFSLGLSFPYLASTSIVWSNGCFTYWRVSAPSRPPSLCGGSSATSSTKCINNSISEVNQDHPLVMANSSGPAWMGPLPGTYLWGTFLSEPHQSVRYPSTHCLTTTWMDSDAEGPTIGIHLDFRTPRFQGSFLFLPWRSLHFLLLYNPYSQSDYSSSTSSSTTYKG
jgi:hypothetical protein